MLFSFWVLGVFLACLSSVLSNLGLNLQKLTHLKLSKDPKNNQNKDEDTEKNDKPRTSSMSSNNSHNPNNNTDEEQEEDDSLKISLFLKSPNEASDYSANENNNGLPNTYTISGDFTYTSQPLWILGLSLVVLGSLLDFSALSFSAQSVIAPLGSLTLVSNTFLAPLLLKEKITKRDVICTITIVIGTILCIYFADHREIKYNIKNVLAAFNSMRFLIYSAVIVGILYCLRVLINHARRVKKYNNRSPSSTRRWTKIMRFCYACSAGIVGAQSVLFAKSTGLIVAASIIKGGHKGETLFQYWQSYFIILGLAITIFLQIKWLNEGLQRFQALYIVPVFQALWILTSVIAGMLFYGEYEAVFNSTPSAIGFPVGVTITVLGVYELSQRKTHDSKGNTAQEEKQANNNNNDNNNINSTNNTNNNETTQVNTSNNGKRSSLISAPVTEPMTLCELGVNPGQIMQINQNQRGSIYANRNSATQSNNRNSIISPLLIAYPNTRNSLTNNYNSLSINDQSRRDSILKPSASDDDIQLGYRDSAHNTPENSTVSQLQDIDLAWYPVLMALSRSWSGGAADDINNHTHNRNKDRNRAQTTFSSHGRSSNSLPQSQPKSANLDLKQ